MVRVPFAGMVICDHNMASSEDGEAGDAAADATVEPNTEPEPFAEYEEGYPDVDMFSGSLDVEDEKR